MATLAVLTAVTVGLCVYLLVDFSSTSQTVSQTKNAASENVEGEDVEVESAKAGDVGAQPGRETEEKTPIGGGGARAAKEVPLTLAGVAYESVARELPSSSPDDVNYVQRSVLDPSFATVRLDTEDDSGGSYYALFLRRDEGKSGEKWSVEKSVRVGDQAFSRDVKTLLTDIPQDLKAPMFPPDDPPEPADEPESRAVQFMSLAAEDDEWKAGPSKSEGGFHSVEVSSSGTESLATTVYLREEDGRLKVAAVGRGLSSAEAPGFPEGMVERAPEVPAEEFETSPASVVRDGEPVEGGSGEGLDLALSDIEGYSGVAGFYAYDLKSGSGYGVRADEEFFSASTIKVAVMASVYRRIEEGRLSYSDRITTTEEDWAAGAGWLRWDTPGAASTVEDSLWLMMTQSDNVATNALIRTVGGPRYVNEVAADLGAGDTNLFWKLSSERGAVPALDNRTTPRDMATMLKNIYEGEGVDDISKDEMVGLMEQNSLEYWMEAGVPAGVPVANKGGWLDSTYNDVGIVEYEDRPYVLVTFTKYGGDMRKGGEFLADISRDVWLAQTGTTKKEYEERQKQDTRDAAGQSPETRQGPGSEDPPSGDQN